MSQLSLFSVLSAMHPLSEGFKKSLSKEIIPVSFPRNYHLLEIPKTAEHVYFIAKGLAMTYAFNDGKKYVEAFWKAGQIMTSTNSFYEQMPTVENIILLQDCDLLSISHSSLLRLFDMHKETHFLYHKIMNRHYAKCRARIYNYQRLSAVERFERLLEFYPDLEQFAPQESIASYLNITPQSLSRIKRERG